MKWYPECQTEYIRIIQYMARPKLVHQYILCDTYILCAMRYDFTKNQKWGELERETERERDRLEAELKPQYVQHNALCRMFYVKGKKNTPIHSVSTHTEPASQSASQQTAFEYESV